MLLDGYRMLWLVVHGIPLAFRTYLEKNVKELSAAFLAGRFLTQTLSLPDKYCLEIATESAAS